MRKSQKWWTTQQLVDELNQFHHKQAAGRLLHYERLLKGLGVCTHCGRTDCERMK